MAHCAQCLVPWTDYGGLYLMEIDRVLRPGGYWVLSGPPINGKAIYKDLDKREKDLEEEHATLEDLAKRLCWKKVAERGSIAIWRKPTNHVHCVQNRDDKGFAHPEGVQKLVKRTTRSSYRSLYIPGKKRDIKEVEVDEDPAEVIRKMIAKLRRCSQRGPCSGA